MFFPYQHVYYYFCLSLFLVGAFTEKHLALKVTSDGNIREGLA
jgi:hypothetical protein